MTAEIRSSDKQQPRVTARLAVAADHDRVARLLALYRAEVHVACEAPPPQLGGELQLILAELGGEALGMLVAQRCHNLLRGATYLLLSDIFVPAEHRQLGVASALMREVKALAARLGCRTLSLVVPDFNIAALTTAARSGFTRHNELFLTLAEE